MTTCGKCGCALTRIPCLVCGIKTSLSDQQACEAEKARVIFASAVEAWRDVRAEDRREALEEIDTLIDIASMNALGVVLERALRRAADLLRAAGGGK